MKGRPNIRTVAKEAGVSVATISRYLNGRFVSAARGRIAEVIAELDYKPSTIARNLSLGRRGCIGVVVDSVQDPWFTQLLVGLEEEVSARDVSLMLASTELTGKYDSNIVVDWIRDRRVDGLIIAKAQHRDRSLIREAVEAKLPAVLVAPNQEFQQVQVVRCDNRSAGKDVARHLCDLGHKHVAFAGGPSNSIDSKQRLSGLREGMNDRGLLLNSSNVFNCGDFEVDAGAKFGRQFFDKSTNATAVVFANDLLAIGFMRVAHKLGVRIPEDLSVVGFNGLPEGERLWVSLTTVAQAFQQMGTAACRRLFESIDSPGPVQTIEFPMTLIVRESTGPARRSGSRSRTANGRGAGARR